MRLSEAERARNREGHTSLIGATAPAILALGLGIAAAQDKSPLPDHARSETTSHDSVERPIETSREKTTAVLEKNDPDSSALEAASDPIPAKPEQLLGKNWNGPKAISDPLNSNYFKANTPINIKSTFPQE